jgi:hypothetical protein
LLAFLGFFARPKAKVSRAESQGKPIKAKVFEISGPTAGSAASLVSAQQGALDVADVHRCLSLLTFVYGERGARPKGRQRPARASTSPREDPVRALDGALRRYCTEPADRRGVR